MFLYGKIFDWTPKHSDNVSKFWFKNENHDTFAKVSRWSNFWIEYFYIFICTYQNHTIIPTVLRNGFSLKLWCNFKFWSTRKFRINSLVPTLFSELKYIVWVLSFSDLKFYLFFWLKVINSTITRLKKYFKSQYRAWYFSDSIVMMTV